MLLSHAKDGPDADVRITIDAAEVRFEISFNLLFIDGIVEVPRADPDAVGLKEYETLWNALFECLEAGNRVRVDGVDVTPVAAGFDVPEADLALLSLFPVHGLRALQQVRLVLEYPLKTEPSSVALLWSAFPKEIVPGAATETAVDVNAFLAARGKEQVIRFSEGEPEFVWHAPAAEAVLQGAAEPPLKTPLLVPWVSVGMIAAVVVVLIGARRRLGSDGFRRWLRLAIPVTVVLAVLTQGLGRAPLPLFSRGLPGAEEALSIFAPLHANIYRAFDYDQESVIYDALARSVHGKLLDVIYNDVYRGLILEDEGGAVCSVDEVKLLHGEVLTVGRTKEGNISFVVRARWRVRGSVYHFGHSHSREIEYQAEYRVAQVPEGWRIVGCNVLSQQRTDDSGVLSEGPKEGSRP